MIHAERGLKHLHAIEIGEPLGDGIFLYKGTYYTGDWFVTSTNIEELKIFLKYMKSVEVDTFEGLVDVVESYIPTRRKQILEAL
jgi:hypothetical protein